MELMPGYKHSDVGIIPDDWDAKPLGEIGDSLIGLTYRPSDVSAYGTLVLRSSNVQNGALRFDDNVFVDTDIPDRIMVKPGDILVCVRNGSRDLIGKSALIDERAVGMTFGAFMGVFRSDYGQFLHHVFQSGIFKKQINEHLGATINQITNKSLNSFKVPLPAADEERKEIARALSDVDALLATLDQMIVKKRDLKQAAMQQLLTGTRRIPGYSGDWDVVAFGDIATIRNEKILCSSAPEGTPCVELEFIGQANGRLLGYIEAKGASSKYSFKESDVLFGRLRAYLRKHWRATFDGVCSTEIWPLIPRNERLYGGYLHLLVQMNSFVGAACVSYGTHMPRSDWAVLRKFEIQLPPVPEQVAISASLSDMDAELEMLENRLDKTRQLKQAMMQGLLTGKTRLV